MATQAQVERFRQANKALVELAWRDLLAFWRALDHSEGRMVRAALEEFFPDLIATYGSTAALLAVDYYDELRGEAPTAKRFRTVMAESVDLEQANAKARWAIGPLFLGDKADPLQAYANLELVSDELVKKAGRDTIIENAAKDPARALWRRVPTGADTCDWCISTAEWGEVYGDEVAPGSDITKFHGKCDCTPAIVWRD